jgi:protein Mpv17
LAYYQLTRLVSVQAHVWYQFLDKHVMSDKASSSKAIVTKMVLDQAIWAPVNTALFYAYLAFADGRLGSLPDTLQAKLLPTILAGYALWPAAHLINFKYIPSSQRLLYINVINLFWTVYLSGMANSTPTIDPVHSQVQRFGLAIPVSHHPSVSPPVVGLPSAPTVVQV